MRKSELIRTLNAVKGARDAANWQGIFTADIRNATAIYRKGQIFDPLDEAAKVLQKELDRLNRKRYRRNTETAQYRAPYKDD